MNGFCRCFIDTIANALAALSKSKKRRDHARVARFIGCTNCERIFIWSPMHPTQRLGTELLKRLIDVARRERLAHLKRNFGK